MPKTKHNNDRSVSRHGTGQKAAKKGGGGGSELILCLSSFVVFLVL